MFLFFITYFFFFREILYNHAIERGMIMSKNKIYKKQKTNTESRKDIMLIISFGSLMVSILALIFSAFSVYYSQKEYKYKLDPRFETRSGIMVKRNNDGSAKYGSSGFSIELLEENNLKSAYIIHANNIAEKKSIEDDTIHVNLNKMEYDLIVGDINYQYKFLLLNSLDDSSELYLIFFKSVGGEIQVGEAANTDIWSYLNGNISNSYYEGERQMAEHYLKVLNGLKECSVNL